MVNEELSQKANNTEYDFQKYRPLKKFFKEIYYTKITIKEAEAIQEEFDGVHGTLELYKSQKNTSKAEKIF